MTGFDPDAYAGAALDCEQDDVPGAVPLDFFLTVADEAPSSDRVTAYDQAHFPTYARLADAADREWRQGVRVLLGRDPVADPTGAWACWSSHLARARWILGAGYRQLADAAH